MDKTKIREPGTGEDLLNCNKIITGLHEYKTIPEYCKVSACSSFVFERGSRLFSGYSGLF
jgi:hypothetical protein